MSVARCCRTGCGHVLPERYSRNYGYLCYECFEELVSLGPDVDINAFLSSSKRPDQELVARTRFDAEFPKVGRKYP